jgi:16S rRNA (uracil1498-N3)-methyltransferase
MYRFYVPPGTVSVSEIELHGVAAHRISRVLRLKQGDTMALFDGTGKEFVVRLNTVDREQVLCAVVSVSEPDTEPKTRVVLYQSLLKGEKFEWVLQKATEVGVSAFVPVVSQRSIPRPLERHGEGRCERWQRIVIEATEQCGRVRVPQVHPLSTFEEGLVRTKEAGVSIIPWERERSVSLAKALTGMPAVVNVFVGPEGGFDEDEVALAREHGVVPVTLGRRILRSETAGVVVPAFVLYHLGELG